MFTPWESKPTAVSPARVSAFAGDEVAARARAEGSSGTPSLTLMTVPPSSSAAMNRPGAPAAPAVSCSEAVSERSWSSPVTFRPSSRKPAGAAWANMPRVTSVSEAPSKQTRSTCAAFCRKVIPSAVVPPGKSAVDAVEDIAAVEDVLLSSDVCVAGSVEPVCAGVGTGPGRPPCVVAGPVPGPGVVDVVRKGSLHPAADTTARTRIAKTMSRTYLTGREYSERLPLYLPGSVT